MLQEDRVIGLTYTENSNNCLPFLCAGVIQSDYFPTFSCIKAPPEYRLKGSDDKAP